MNATLKDIPGFPGYKCNEDGTTIISYRRPVPKQKGYNVSTNGYLQVFMMKGSQRYITSVHRMVALAFVPNDDVENKIQVHHIDHNKKNNHYSNLEWVTPSHNITMNYKTGGQVGRAGLEGKHGRDNPESRLIKQYHPEDGLIACFWSINEAARLTNSHAGHIAGVCRGVKRTHNRFIWRYVF